MSAELFGGNSKEQIKAIVERVERLTEERRGLTQDIAEVMNEAQGQGFDKKTIREMIKLRKMDEADRVEQEYLRDQYAIALGLDLV